MTKEEATKIASHLTFEPRNRFSSHGNEIQICETTYLNTIISNTTFFPWNVFKGPIDIFTVDLIVSAETKIQGGEINVNMYTDSGYGYPQFTTIEDAIIFIKAFKIEKLWQQ
jgi:hypothetical protein